MEFYIPLTVVYPQQQFVHAPSSMIKESDGVSELVTDELLQSNNFLYLYEPTDDEARLQLQLASELSLPSIDIWYLLNSSRQYCGYYIRTKATCTAHTNSSIVSYSNAFKRTLKSDEIPKVDLCYSTDYFSGFSSLSGCSMLLRQFNSESILSKLEA